MKSLKNHMLEDRAYGIIVRIGEDARAHVSWRDGSCWVGARQLEVGRWVPMAGEDPTIYVVCRVTALVVAAAIKEDVLGALEGLP